MIRIAVEADVPAILSIYAPYILTTTYTFEYTVPSDEEFLQRFRDTTQQFPWLVWEEDGQILGYAYGSAPFARAAYRWCCEGSIYLRPQARGRGIGKKLYLALEAIFRMQGYRKAYAIITSENSDSLAFHRRLGYEHLAEFPECGFKHGRWLGVTWMEKTLKSDTIPSFFPTPWPSVMQDVEKFPNILDILSLS